MCKITLNLNRSFSELILLRRVCRTLKGIVSEKQLAAESPTVEKTFIRKRVIVEIDSENEGL